MIRLTEKYGHVMYRPGLIPATGPCEIPGCETARLAELTGQFMLATSATDSVFLCYREPCYMVDHCHRHGFIRGMLCGTCNNLMKEYDRNGYYQPSGWEFSTGRARFADSGFITRVLGLREYSRNCPGCTW